MFVGLELYVKGLYAVCWVCLPDKSGEAHSEVWGEGGIEDEHASILMSDVVEEGYCLPLVVAYLNTMVGVVFDVL